MERPDGSEVLCVAALCLHPQAYDAPDLRYPIIEPSGAFIMTRKVTMKAGKFRLLFR